MGNTGVKYPAAVSTIQEVGDDNDWTTPANVGADDAAYASITAATFDAGDVSYLLRATNLSMGVPTGAIIVGILVEIERYYASGSGLVEDVDVVLTKDGTTRVGSDYSAGADFTTSPAVVSFGGVADLWGTTWSVAEVNATTFGVFYKMGAVANNADGFVDFIRVTTYYTLTSQQTLAATAIGIAVLSKISTRYRTLAATAIGVATLAALRIYLRALTAVAVGVATLTKVTTYARSLQAVAVGLATLSRVVTHYRTLVATSIGAAVMSRAITYSRTLAATAIGLPGISRAVTYYRTIASTVVGVAELVAVKISTAKDSVWHVIRSVIRDGG